MVDITTKYDPIETAKRHLRDCMESPDYPVHNCYVTCNDVAYLLAEVERLRAAQTAILEQNERFATELTRLRTLIDKHNDECRECPVIES